MTVYVDEAPAVFGNEALSEPPIGFGKDTVLAMSSQFATVVKRGAKTGASVGLGTQYPTIGATFGNNPMGPGIHANINARCHFDGITESLVSAFDSGRVATQESIRLVRQGVPGRMLYTFLNDEDRGDVPAGQVVWLEDEQVRELALRKRGVPA